MIDVGDVLVELQGSNKDNINVVKQIDSSTLASELEQFFDSVPDTSPEQIEAQKRNNETSIMDIQLVFVREFEIRGMPIMPSPVMMGPFQRKNIKITRALKPSFESITKQQIGKQKSLIKYLVCHEVLASHCQRVICLPSCLLSMQGSC